MKGSSIRPGATRDGRPVSCSTAARTLGERRVDRAAACAAAAVHPPTWPVLRRPHRDTAPHDLAREPAAALMVGHCEHGSGMSLCELPALDHPEHVVR